MPNMYETDLPSASHSVVAAARNINEYYLRTKKNDETKKHNHELTNLEIILTKKLII